MPRATAKTRRAARPRAAAKQKAPGEVCLEPCPIERGMRVIGGKWKGSILWHLKDGPVRFNELTRLLGGATRKIVNERLKEMESQGLVVRRVLSERPIAVTYEISDFGRSTLGILDQLQLWAEEHGI
ncbi:transcriptional regulator [Acidobacteria bacterium Mor1]|nr:transcriptional regulator [Acidobacteria bacterium Mor1]